jgi:hypothetical protein
MPLLVQHLAFGAPLPNANATDGTGARMSPAITAARAAEAAAEAAEAAMATAVAAGVCLPYPGVC